MTLVDAAGPAQTVGVHGLGPIGLAVARAVAATRPVRVYDAAPGLLDEATAAGLVAADSAADLARAANTVLLSLPGAAAVEDAVRALAPAAPGLVLVGLSVLAPRDATRISEIALAEGSLYLDVPVAAPAAEVGRWRLAMGGPAGALGLMAGVLAAVAAEVVHAGPVGSPTRIVH